MDIQTSDLESLPRQAEAHRLLKELIVVAEMAEDIVKSLPKVVKEELVAKAGVSVVDEDIVEQCDKTILAMALAQINPASRVSRLASLYETLEFIDGDFDASSEDVEIAHGIMGLCQRLGSMSRKALVQALEEPRDKSYLLVRIDGRNSEVIRKYSVSDQVLKEFGLD